MFNLDEDEASINSYTNVFFNSRCKRIFAKYWEPKQASRAMIFIAHGFAEHCLPYDKLARTLALKGFFVFSHDHVGHGQSGGPRVHIDNFHHYVQDVLEHVDVMKKVYTNLPVFLCGHSMGGAISILAALEKPDVFKGVVLIAPAIATNPEITTGFKIIVARALRRLFPNFPLGKLNYYDVCSCPKKVKMMLDDPLRYHGYCKAGFGVCLIDACLEVQNKASLFTTPFFLLQAENDKVCDPTGIRTFYEKSPAQDKIFKVYPNAYHALCLEPNGIAERVTQDIVDWFVSRS